jgi:hypothetical protein
LRGRLGWLLLVVLVAAGFGVVASRSPAPDDRAPTGDAARAADAIQALLDNTDPITRLPDDFTAVTGVTPGTATAPDGTTKVVHPNGGCSTPWGEDDTRWTYTVWCQAHDLGYDLLRYAEAKGQPLGAAAREQLDDRLSADMHAQCDIDPRGSARVCRVVATLYSAGMVANSWHQRWGPPRAEPIATWLAGLLVVIALLAVRVPVLGRRPVTARRRPTQIPKPDDRASYLAFLRVVALSGFVVAESVLALAPLTGSRGTILWPVTWLLQLVPLFFFSGGYSNLLTWQTTKSAGYGRYLAGRVCRLIRPVLALVTAWLVVPLSLDLLDAPAEAVRAVDRLVVQPLWLLGLYLLVVSMTPAMHWLHRRAPVATVVALACVVMALGWSGSGTAAAHAGGVALALLFAQLSFHYADGTLWLLPRATIVGVAVTAVVALTLLTTVGGQSPLLIAEPAGTATFVPSAVSVLLIGVVQVCVAVLPRQRGVRALARGAPARATRFIRSAPMTVYLGYLCATLMIAGIIGAARTAGLPTSAVDWIVRPRSLFAFALLGVPTALAFVLFEWRSTLDPDAGATRDRTDARRDALAAALGTGYGAAGILGFALTGLTGTHETPVLLGLPLDPMSSIIHLLLGWYLLHSVRTGTAATPWPWLLTAVACVPPMITSHIDASTTNAIGGLDPIGVAVHGLTIAVALTVAFGMLAALPRSSEAMATVKSEPLATADSVP